MARKEGDDEGIGGEGAVPPASRRTSTRRLFAVFGTATLLAQVGQLLWLTAGSRSMARETFGAVLAAQALYGVLQFVIDSGTTYHGARLVAASQLDDSTRASLVRVRVQLAAVAVAVTIAVATLGGLTSLLAHAPYLVALVLWALFNYWEAYGRGDGRPLSAYLVLRAAGPPAAATAFLVADERMPPYVAGIAECAALVLVGWFYRLRLFQALVSAVRADRGPWKKVVTIGLPSISWQIGLASGVVLLGVARAPALAAVLGVAVRLLTGVNQLTAVLATAIFPALARTGEPLHPPASWNVETRMIDVAARIVLCVSSAAVATYLIGESFFVGLFLQNADVEAEQTAAITLGTAGVAGISLLMSFVLIARHREGAAAIAFATGAAVSVILGVTVVVFEPSPAAVWMAGALAAGQLTSMILSVRGTAAIVPALRRPLGRAAFQSAATLAAVSIAAFVEETRLPIAAAIFVLGSAPLLRGARSLRRSAAGALRG